MGTKILRSFLESFKDRKSEIISQAPNKQGRGRIFYLLINLFISFYYSFFGRGVGEIFSKASL